MARLTAARIRVGTAGWAIPRAEAAAFPTEGSALARYAARFDTAEINSSFHRPHRASTYARWAQTVPAGFRFAVKLPKTITHERRLVAGEEELDRFLGEVAQLGGRLGPLLVQLPPKLAFEPGVAEGFFATLRHRHSGQVVCEPRHPGWFGPEAEALLVAHRIARVAADPAPVPDAANPGGWSGLAYHRLHGAPRTYWSRYEPDVVAALAERFRSPAVETWCIFDNTASGAAAANACELADRLSPPA